MVWCGATLRSRCFLLICSRAHHVFRKKFPSPPLAVVTVQSIRLKVTMMMMSSGSGSGSVV